MSERLETLKWARERMIEDRARSGVAACCGMPGRPRWSNFSAPTI